MQNSEILKNKITNAKFVEFAKYVYMHASKTINLTNCGNRMSCMHPEFNNICRSDDFNCK